MDEENHLQKLLESPEEGINPEPTTRIPSVAKAGKITNQQILFITTLLFGGFVVAEVIGALASNSLALLGDASAMMVDVFTVSLSPN